MELSFAWFWKQSEFSDFQLVLRPRPAVEPAPRQCEQTGGSGSAHGVGTTGASTAGVAAQGPPLHENAGPAGPSGSSPHRTTTRSMARGAGKQSQQQHAHQQQQPQQPEQGSAVEPEKAKRGRRLEQANNSKGPPPAPPAALGTRRSSRIQTVQKQGADVGNSSSVAAASSTPGAQACQAQAESKSKTQEDKPETSAGAEQGQELGCVTLPVHATVLTATSEYFKTLIQSWSGSLNNRVITLTVDADDMDAAQLMLEYMYTGVLPRNCDPGELLRMIKLADQYRVNRFLAACNSALDKVPVSQLTLDNVISILTLPSFLLESSTTATARKRAQEKLTEMFGDLEAAWFDETLRKEFQRLPFAAVRYLVSRTETAVYNENTILVAIADWLAVQQRRPGSTVLEEQAGELFTCVRIPFLTASYLAILDEISWVRGRFSTKMLLKAFQLSKAEGRVHEVLMQQLGMSAIPRSVPERSALEMEWSVRKADICELVNECRAETAASVESTRLFSEPGYYHGGFFWKMVFFVQKKKEVKKRRYGDAHDVSGADEESVYHDFLGITCKAQLGNEVFTPLVGMVVEFTANRYNALGEPITPQRAEVAGYVEDEIPYGVYDFFRVDNLGDANAITPFCCAREHIHVACKITRCN